MIQPLVEKMAQPVVDEVVQPLVIFFFFLRCSIIKWSNLPPKGGKNSKESEEIISVSRKKEKRKFEDNILYEKERE